ncbi:beta-galactosidase [Bacteroides thetaiotaomicron]|uniref:beta-galactosidase n=1 Tax=Bacteroides thetaiotaomicron TaxID=818 RepID=UPI0018AA7CB6
MKQLFSIIILIFFCSCMTKKSFEVSDKTFLLNGRPFVIKAAEIHYPRVPKEYWEHRIQMCKALGMNTICLYIFWNYHEMEEGKLDFNGQKDIAAFCKLAQKHGLYVIIRPGPYVCAEWDMGGLPWWLLKKKDIRLREQDPYFMERTRIFINEVGKRLSNQQITRGGNIIMVQVENEYGAFGTNRPYIKEIKDMVKAAGFTDVPLFQCDWSSNFEKNALDDLLWTINFGTGANINKQFERLKKLRPNTPLMCSEYWSGWFDHWGARHETRSKEALVNGLKEMLDNNISFSLYMTHGGTSFGHWAGANYPGYVPDCTSYDYDAPISESGKTTPKFYAVRDLLKQYLPKGEKQTDIPNAIPSIHIPEFEITEAATLFGNLPTCIASEHIQPMEKFNQGWGSILYRTTLPATKRSQILKITDVHDWAQIFINGQKIGTLSRLKREGQITLPILEEGAVLDILVEAMGRINFDKGIYDWKGITQSVELIDQEQAKRINNWEVYCFPTDYLFSKNLHFKQTRKPLSEPAYYKGIFTIDTKGDTFMDMSSWGKGMVWVNGYAIGRYWGIGPQQTLYVPGCWLKEGKNEIIVLEMLSPSKLTIKGLNSPILNILKDDNDYTHKKQDEHLDLSKETVFHKGSFKSGNGWQHIKFDRNETIRYFCIEALSSHGADKHASIAELELLDKNGNPISRHNWKICYVSSEETNKANNMASNIFDLQESTFWHTDYSNMKSSFPHQIIIDLGTEQTITGFSYLPRNEVNKSGMIKDYRIYVKRTPFIR